MSIVLGLNQVFHAGSYALNMRHKWFQLPCDKYHRWHHCVNNFELQAPNNIHMKNVGVILAHSRVFIYFFRIQQFSIFFSANLTICAKNPVGGDST